MLFCHPFCSVVDVGFFCDGFCLRIDCVGGVCTGFLVGSCNAVPQEFVVLRLVKCVKVLSAGMKAFVELLILLMSLLSLFWNLLLTFLNFTLCTMSRGSASNLSNSLFCGGHFLDLKPKLLLVTTLLLSFSLRSKKNAFHLIRLMTLSTFSIRLLR